jgi:hypothetical protein
MLTYGQMLSTEYRFASVSMSSLIKSSVSPSFSRSSAKDSPLSVHCRSSAAQTCSLESSHDVPVSPISCSAQPPSAGFRTNLFSIDLRSNSNSNYAIE